MIKSPQTAFQTASTLLLLLPLLAHPAISGAQALPAASASPISTGFSLPSTSGTLQYALSASQSLTSNYLGNSGVASFTNLTGDLAFIASSSRDPFSAVFTGGRSWSTSGQPSYNYLNLSLSQAVNTHRWVFSLSDAVNYMPQTASTGLSGIPGAGDLGVAPVPTEPTRPRRNRKGRPGTGPHSRANQRQPRPGSALRLLHTRHQHQLAQPAAPDHRQDLAQRLRLLRPHPLPQ